MKKIILISLIMLVFSYIKAQYQGGFGVYISTPEAVSSPHFQSSNNFVYEFSFKAYTNASSCFDIIGGWANDNVNFTIMKEVHHPIFYPIDWYLGLGANMGLWNKNHWNDGATTHDNTFAGLDGSLGLQMTLFPIAFSVGIRPVYMLYGGDQFYWLKQIGVRICFR